MDGQTDILPRRSPRYAYTYASRGNKSVTLWHGMTASQLGQRTRTTNARRVAQRGMIVATVVEMSVGPSQPGTMSKRRNVSLSRPFIALSF